MLPVSAEAMGDIGRLLAVKGVARARELRLRIAIGRRRLIRRSPTLATRSAPVRRQDDAGARSIALALRPGSGRHRSPAG